MNKPVVIVVNGPSCAGKSTITNCFRSKVDPRAWAMVDFDNVTEREAGVKASDSDDVIELKLHRCVIKKIMYAVKNGKNVICDTILREKPLVVLYKGMQNCRLVMCFLHNSLPQLVINLENRNVSAKTLRAADRYLEKRSFQQVLKDFGRFYLPSDVGTGMGVISRQQMGIVFESREAKAFERSVSDKNGQRPGSPRPLDEFMDRFLSEYPIFRCLKDKESVNLQLINDNLYDLIIDHASPELSAEKILEFIQQN